jgi:Divergent InlB B-repeat domain
MHRKGSRCGIVTRARFGRRASTLALLALLGLLVSALPASGSQAPGAVAGSATIVIHGQGRVTSEPAGAIDCPTTCSFSFAGSTTLTLRAAPASGYVTAEIGSCADTDVCVIPLNDFAYTIHVYFRPRAKLQLWPNGDGAITVSPQPADWRGESTDASCTPANSFEGTGCEFYYLPGTPVTATASPSPASSFLGFSTPGCAKTSVCTINLSRDSSLVARFTPLEVRVIRGGNGTGSITSEPSGIACPPTCTALFPAGSQVTLVALPDAASPFLSWKFGCAVSTTDPRRCTLTATNRPNWVGVALGEDDTIGVPTTLAVLFDVARVGSGVIKGLELDCGAKCEHRYVFGTREKLVASPASGWRFTQWNGACAKAATCSLYIGPVTTLGALFTENLAPQLQSVKATGRKLTVRLSVRHTAQVRLQLRRNGAGKVLADRRFALKGGANAVVLAVPAKVKSGLVRLTISVSDGLGGGRTYSRVLKVGQ